MTMIEDYPDVLYAGNTELKRRFRGIPLYQGRDPLGCWYTVVGGGQYWDARYVKKGYLTMSVGEVVAEESPEDALKLLMHSREAFIPYLRSVNNVTFSTSQGSQVISPENCDFLRRLKDSSSVLDTESSYKAILRGAKPNDMKYLEVLWVYFLSEMLTE